MPQTPLATVWEITMACNMQCKHCGSQCGKQPLPGQLTTSEALHLCDELADLGLKVVTLSGGEPLLRRDWPRLATRLIERGVVVTMISNGWLLNKSAIEKARDCGVESIAMSLDGMEKNHDRIRRKGSFSRIMKALDLLREAGVTSSIITTLMKDNFGDLPTMKELLAEKGVRRWQMQMGIPMGSLEDHPGSVIAPSQLTELVDFLQTVLDEGKIRPFPADNIGYCSKQLNHIRSETTGGGGKWFGCTAGKKTFGILHDGCIVGCTSLRDRSYVEGNIRETPLSEIWSRPNGFAWNRDLTVDQLDGFCRGCQFAEQCLGGCSTVKRFTSENMSENVYCVYRQSVEKLIPKIRTIRDLPTLLSRARTATRVGLYEMAEPCLARANRLAPNRLDILRPWGFALYKVRNYKKSLAVNRRALKMAPDDAYSLAGLGLCLVKTGRIDAGIDALKKAVAHAPVGFDDPFNDLAVVLFDQQRYSEALDVLKQGRKRSRAFVRQSAELHKMLLEKVRSEKEESAATMKAASSSQPTEPLPGESPFQFYERFMRQRSPAEKHAIANMKRCVEHLMMDKNLRRELEESPRNAREAFTKRGLVVDPMDIKPLWLIKARSRKDRYQKWPLTKLWQDWADDVASFRNLLRLDPVHDPAPAGYLAWRRRQMGRNQLELGQNSRSIVYPAFSFELTRGCSMGCKFCAFSAPELTGVFRYTPGNARLWNNMLKAGIDRFGREMFTTAFCYHATEPFDNPDYVRFIMDIYKLTGIMPTTTTATATRNLAQTRELLALHAKHPGYKMRFSVLSLAILRKIHREFTADELLHVGCLPQNRDSILQKAGAGRSVLAPEQFNGTIACVAGYLVNMVDKTIRLISPCNASEQWPLGYRVHAEGRFRTAGEFGNFLDRTMSRHMPQDIPEDQPLKFQEAFAYTCIENGFRLSIADRRIRFATGGGCGRLVGIMLAQGRWTVPQILERVSEQKESTEVAMDLLQKVFDRGLLHDLQQDLPCPARSPRRKK